MEKEWSCLSDNHWTCPCPIPSPMVVSPFEITGCKISQPEPSQGNKTKPEQQNKSLKQANKKVTLDRLPSLLGLTKPTETLLSLQGKGQQRAVLPYADFNYFHLFQQLPEKKKLLDKQLRASVTGRLRNKTAMTLQFIFPFSRPSNSSMPAWSHRSELLSFLSTQEFRIPREMKSVLLCSQSPNLNLAVAERLYVNWGLHVVQGELDLLPRHKMGVGNHHSALSRAGGKTENIHCSRKAHSFRRSDTISRFI